MATSDLVCSIYPYFLVPEENMEKFQELCDRFVEKTHQEPKCLYYGFSFNGLEVHCREAYEDADALLNHLQNVGDILNEALQISELTRLEIHGAASELAKLKEPLKDFAVQYFELQYGFRN
jgi:quinol monooxygenase YgiN